MPVRRISRRVRSFFICISLSANLATILTMSSADRATATEVPLAERDPGGLSSGPMPFAGLLLSIGLQSAAPEVSYSLLYREARPGVVSVRIDLPAASPGPRILVIPRAIPMGYGEQPFDRFVSSVEAFSSDGSKLAVERIEGPRWHLGTADSAVTRIDYDVDIARMEREVVAASDTSKARPGYLSLLGYSIFGYVEGLEESPIRLDLAVPESWPLLTTLAPRLPLPKGRDSASAGNFYALADSQIVAGPKLEVRPLATRPPAYFALYAEGETDIGLLCELAEKGLSRIHSYFGEAPYAHYTVLQELLEPLSERHRYGFSMEHLDSATFYLAKDAGLTASSTSSDRDRVLYNFAHHFAHAWIPKRSYGKGYYPFTWELAPVLDTIWFSEGFAQYAAIEAIADGLPEEEARAYRENLLERRFRQSLATAPAFIRRMPLVDLSRVASTRYSEDFRTGRTVFSRGGLMAAEIDDRIQRESRGAHRLRDALRHLISWSRKNGRPFEIEELPAIFEEATRVDTREIFDGWLAPLEVHP
jgi:predicted metalloprotease with PDZ domain